MNNQRKVNDAMRNLPRTIDERDEPPRLSHKSDNDTTNTPHHPTHLILLPQPQPRNIAQKHSPELPRDLQIVRRAQRAPAQLFEREQRDVRRALRHAQRAAPYVQLAPAHDGVGRVGRGERVEELRHLRARARVERVVVYVRERTGNAAVVYQVHR